MAYGPRIRRLRRFLPHTPRSRVARVVENRGTRSSRWFLLLSTQPRRVAPAPSSGPTLSRHGHHAQHAARARVAVVMVYQGDCFPQLILSDRVFTGSRHPRACRRVRIAVALQKPPATLPRIPTSRDARNVNHRSVPSSVVAAARPRQPARERCAFRHAAVAPPPPRPPANDAQGRHRRVRRRGGTAGRRHREGVESGGQPPASSPLPARLASPRPRCIGVCAQCERPRRGRAPHARRPLRERAPRNASTTTSRSSTRSSSSGRRAGKEFY